MPRTARSLILPIILAGVSTLAHGQDTPPEPVAENAAPNGQQVVQQFLDRKAVAQARRDARLARQGATTDDRELRRLIRALGVRPPQPSLGVTSTQETQLRDSLITDAAQLLAFLDIKPAKVRKLQEGGFNPLEAAIDYTRGSGDLLVSIRRGPPCAGG